MQTIKRKLFLAVLGCGLLFASFRCACYVDAIKRASIIGGPPMDTITPPSLVAGWAIMAMLGCGVTGVAILLSLANLVMTDWFSETDKNNKGQR